MFALLFFVSLVSAESGFMYSSPTKDNSLAMGKIVEKKCQYLGQDSAVIEDILANLGVQGVKSIILEMRSNGIHILSYMDYQCAEGKGEDIIPYDDITKKSLTYYETLPTHAGFESYLDDKECSHSKSILRSYYLDSCLAKEGGGYTKYVIQEGNLVTETYLDENCQKKDQIYLPQTVFQCNQCVEGIQYGCGSIATSLLAALLLILFFIF